MGTRIMAATILLALLCGSMAVAEDAWFIDPDDTAGRQAGMTELGVAPAYLPKDGAAEEAYQLLVTYGRFYNKDLQVGLQWWGNDDVQSIGAFGTSYVGSIDGVMRPFVSASLGYRFLDAASDRARGADDASLWSVGAGVKYFQDVDKTMFFKYMFAESDDVDDDMYVIGYSKLWH